MIGQMNQSFGANRQAKLAAFAARFVKDDCATHRATSFYGGAAGVAHRPLGGRPEPLPLSSSHRQVDKAVDGGGSQVNGQEAYAPDTAEPPARGRYARL